MGRKILVINRLCTECSVPSTMGQLMLINRLQIRWLPCGLTLLNQGKPLAYLENLCMLSCTCKWLWSKWRRPRDLFSSQSQIFQWDSICQKTWLWKAPEEWSTLGQDFTERWQTTCCFISLSDSWHCDTAAWSTIISHQTNKTVLSSSGMQRGILILKHSPLQLLFVFSNPNLPVTLPSGSVWPQFEENADMFMELNSTSSTVISTPKKERLDAIIADLFSARTLQLRADSPPGSKKLSWHFSKLIIFIHLPLLWNVFL